MKPEQPAPEEQWQQPAMSAGTPHAYAAAPTTQQADVEPQTPAEPTARQPLSGEEDGVRWQGPEYLHRDKTIRWYIVFALVVIAFFMLAIFLFRSITFALLIPVMAASLAIYSTRPPMMVNYILSRKGLHVNDRLYPYTDFKEFSLISDDIEHAVYLVPRERFRLGMTVYFPESAGEGIVDMLAARLPMKAAHNDPIERLLRKLHI